MSVSWEPLKALADSWDDQGRRDALLHPQAAAAMRACAVELREVIGRMEAPP